MRKLTAILISTLLILLSHECPINPSSLSSSLNCISNIICSTTTSGQDAIIFQNCNKTWFFGTNSTAISSISSSHPNSFVNKDQIATNIKQGISSVIINYNYTMLYFYPLGSTTYHKRFASTCTFLDYQALDLGGGSTLLLKICLNEISTIVLYSNLNNGPNTVLNTDENLSKIQCFNSSILCAIGTQNGSILIFNTSSNSIIKKYTNYNYPSVTLLKSTQINSTNSHKLYISFSDGNLQQLIIKNNGQVKLLRKSDYFKGQVIHALGNYHSSNYLVISDKRGNVSQIDLSTGILMDSLNVQSYLSVKTDVAMSLLLHNSTSYYIYNTANSAIFFASITPNNSKNHVVLKCFTLQFYNNSVHECQPCSATCSTCDSLTGKCIKCIQDYFNSNGQCLSCFYDSRGITQHFDECFSSNQKLVMQTSQTMATFLSALVSNFAVFLNLFGILFLFLKLINNWNIICLYFFVQIQQPFFLQNVLSILFNNFSSSVLKKIGIDFKWSFGTANRATAKKFQLAGVNTDFLEMNYQQIILFLYSIVLITTLYKIINYLLARVKISVFQQNTAISIIQEFIGCFTITLVPFYYVLFQPHFRSRWQKINSSAHLLFVGLALIAPFLFLIFDYEYKIIRTNKVQNNDQNHIAQSVNLGLTKRIQAWREQDSKQRFFFGLLSFVTAILVCNPNVKLFIFGVGFIHILWFINSLLSKKMRKNNILQKLSFLSYHCLFSSLHFIDNANVKFRISLVLVLLIVLITVHQLVLSFYLKIYFLYMLIKGKLEKQERIKLFFQKNQKKMKNKNRVHPVNLPEIVKKPEPPKQEQIKELNFKFKNFQLKIVRDKERKKPEAEAKVTPQKKKYAKSAKKIDENSLRIKDLEEDSHYSLEKKELKTERRARF